MQSKKKSNGMLMTEGVIWKQLIIYSIPLLIGNLFQQLYNTVDSVVVGRYIGSSALAAVGASAPVLNLIIGMFMGISVGSGVIISQYYGAKDEQKMSWAIHTSIALSIIGGILLTIVGVVLSPTILRLMKTPDAVMVNSVLYFRILFMGSLFNLLYNMGAGMLQAVGDSKRPLYYLCISSVINIVLDILFVSRFHMGVDGVAYATIISQFVSMALSMVTLMRADDIYRLSIKKIKIDVRMMKRVLSLGLPSGVQQSVVSLSNVIVQTNINMYGAMAMAGFGAYNMIEGFVVLPMMSFCMTATTFTGQNIGAGKPERVKQGMKQGMIICLIYTVIISIVLFFKVENVLRIFSEEEGVVYYGNLAMLIMVPFYTVLSIHQILMGTLRGAGKSMQSMLISVGNMCVIRMLYINFVVPYFPSYEAVMWGYPITWTTMVIMDYIYLKKGNWTAAMDAAVIKSEKKKEIRR
ncbi:MAG: MATE family efflux transporter [Clostridium sp.]